MALSTFTLMWYQHHHPSTELFSFYKTETLYLFFRGASTAPHSPQHPLLGSTTTEGSQGSFSPEPFLMGLQPSRLGSALAWGSGGTHAATTVGPPMLDTHPGAATLSSKRLALVCPPGSLPMCLLINNCPPAPSNHHSTLCL